MIAGWTWMDMARVGEERLGDLIEGGEERRGFINLRDLGGVRGVGKANEPVPKEDTDAEGVNGEYLRTLEGVDGVSLLVKAVTLGEGGSERVQGELR
jgi:hypothetical protein